MKKRTNTAVWVESARRWQLKVQKDGVRRTFTSSKPGRTGQRECNAKADAWLDDGIEEQSRRVNDLFAAWYASVKASTSEGNWRPLESRWRVHILPVLGQKRLDKISEGQWQDVINALYAEGASKKSLQNYCADIRAFISGAALTATPPSAWKRCARPRAPASGSARFCSPTTCGRCFPAIAVHGGRSPALTRLCGRTAFRWLPGCAPVS